MEILKRARGFQSGEGIPWNADPKDVQQEVNHRAWKAGYTDRDGQPLPYLPGGGRYRSISHKYRENYEKAFGHN